MENGYARINAGDGKIRYLHRFVWEQFNGPIPEGLHLDHLCFNRKCCNPHHLDPVPAAINNRRRPGVELNRRGRLTKCINGHAYTPETPTSTGAASRAGRAVEKTNGDTGRRS